ncbi:MAG TPA: hypothetical protein VKV33_00045, partial [Streptosporangiaceae bacterium]|nr:hypothetical protein [Streptosporangiaceae bacterium]
WHDSGYLPDDAGFGDDGHARYEPSAQHADGHGAGPRRPDDPTVLLDRPPGLPGGSRAGHDGRRAGLPGERSGIRPRRRRRIPLWLKGAAVVAVAGLVFRRVIAWAVLTSLSAALHLVGIGVHLPSVKLAWPWQTIGAGTTTNTDLGPLVLQKVEGISRPALGSETFDFYFTHKVSKNIGPLPCWYSSTFYAVGHASATVNLNPGPSWWTPATGHYRLRVLSRPAAGRPGHVAVTMVLPPPQLPQSAHDVTIDDTLSKPINIQHSWTYPGFGCGVLLRPQFSPSVLYSLAQGLAFQRATQVPQVTRPLIGAAETEATQMVRDNFIQPTLNSLGYDLDSFTLRWASAPQA